MILTTASVNTEVVLHIRDQWTGFVSELFCLHCELLHLPLQILHLHVQPLFILKKLLHLLRLSDCLSSQHSAHHRLQQSNASAQVLSLHGAGTAGFHWAVHSEGVLADTGAVIRPADRGSVPTPDIQKQRHQHCKLHPHDLSQV